MALKIDAETASRLGDAYHELSSERYADDLLEIATWSITEQSTPTELALMSIASSLVAIAGDIEVLARFVEKLPERAQYIHHHEA